MGFAQEVKDFLGSWQAGEKINASRTDREYKDALTDATKQKTTRDNDPDTLKLQDETARANLSKIKAGIGAIGANTSLTNERRGLIKDQRGILTAPPSSGLAPPPGAVGAVPQSTINVDGDAEQQFAEGGLVEEEPAEDETASVPVEGALPIGDAPAAPAAAPTDLSARSRSLEGVVSPALVADAAKAGLTFGVNSLGLSSRGGVQTAAQRAAATRYARGEGGLTDGEVEAVKKAVDPEGKLTDAQRNVAALGSVYQYQLNKGNPEGAQKVAFQMLQHYRAMSMRYAAIAAHAAQEGNLDLATQAAVKAYANVPDGRDVEIFKDEDGKLNYSYTDAHTGKTIAKGLVTPQQLVSSAMGMAQGGFDKAILSAAGAREDPKAKGPKAATTADRKNMGAMADEAVGKFEADYAAKAEKDKSLQPLDPEYTGSLRDATQHFLAQNPKATPREAFNAARQLYALDDSGKDGFKISKSEDEDGTSTIKFDSGHKMKLSDDQLEPILMARAAKIKAQNAKDDAEEDAKDVPGVAEKVGNAVKGAVDLTSQGISSMWDAIKARDPKVRAMQAVPASDTQDMPR